MKFSTSNLLTKKNLLKKIDSYSIFRAYCANFDKVGQSFRSDLPDRHKLDTNASCQIAYIRGDLLYTDFGESSYRSIDYVMRKYHIEYKDALRKINSDFRLGLYDPSDTKTFGKTPVYVHQPKQVFKERTPTIIDVKYTNWSQEDLQYWYSFGWTLDMLNRASIKPIDYFWLTMQHKGIHKHPFSCKDELAYSYDFYRHKRVFRRKLYFPERMSGRRWTSNVDSTIIQNWDLLPKQGGDTLYIASSKKDSGVHWRLNGHYCNSLAPNTEVSFIPEEIFYRKLKPRWERIIIFIDNDKTGILNALKWSKKYQIEAVWIPERCPQKDQAAYVNKYGLREFNYLQQKLISCQK